MGKLPINVKCKREEVGSNALEARNDTKLIREEKGQLKKSMVNKTKDNKMKFINCCTKECLTNSYWSITTMEMITLSIIL